MRELDWLSRDRVIPSVRRRLLFRDRPVTYLLITAIVVWYLFQQLVVLAGWETNHMLWAFTTESFPALSPGLFFAIISHAYPPQVTHLLGNIAFLWLFGAESEQHMHTIEAAGFFLATAQISVLVSTAISGENTMGASGGALAFVGFYCTHMIIEHRDEFEFEKVSEGYSIIETPKAHVGVVLALLPIAIVAYLGGQLAGIIPVGQSDIIGHFVGIVLGVGYAGVRSVLL